MNSNIQQSWYRIYPHLHASLLCLKSKAINICVRILHLKISLQGNIDKQKVLQNFAVQNCKNPTKKVKVLTLL